MIMSVIEMLGGAALIGVRALTLYSSRAEPLEPWSRIWFLRFIEVPEAYDRIMLAALGAVFVACGALTLYRGLGAR